VGFVLCLPAKPKRNVDDIVHWLTKKITTGVLCTASASKTEPLSLRFLAQESKSVTTIVLRFAPASKS
jgi:hypothetical protein